MFVACRVASVLYVYGVVVHFLAQSACQIPLALLRYHIGNVPFSVLKL